MDAPSDAPLRPRSPSLAGPWLALLVLAIPVATAGALCSLVAPYWVVDIGPDLRAELEQRWLLVVPVRQRDLGTLDRVELAVEEVKRPGPVRVGGGAKEGSYRLVLHHDGDRRTELPAGKREGATRELELILAGELPTPTAVWVGKPILGLVAPLLLISLAAVAVATFFTRLLRRG